MFRGFSRSLPGSPGTRLRDYATTWLHDYARNDEGYDQSSRDRKVKEESPR